MREGGRGEGWTEHARSVARAPTVNYGHLQHAHKVSTEGLAVLKGAQA